MTCPAVCFVMRVAARSDAGCSFAAVLYYGLLTYLAMRHPSPVMPGPESVAYRSASGQTEGVRHEASVQLRQLRPGAQGPGGPSIAHAAKQIDQPYALRCINLPQAVRLGAAFPKPCEHGLCSCMLGAWTMTW